MACCGAPLDGVGVPYESQDRESCENDHRWRISQCTDVRDILCENTFWEFVVLKTTILMFVSFFGLLCQTFVVATQSCMILCQTYYNMFDRVPQYLMCDRVSFDNV